MHMNIQITNEVDLWITEHENLKFQILRGTCFECHQLSAKLSILHLMKCQLKALDYGLINLVDELRDALNTMKVDSGGEKSLVEDAAIQKITVMADNALEGNFFSHASVPIP